MARVASVADSINQRHPVTSSQLCVEEKTYHQFAHATPRVSSQLEDFLETVVQLTNGGTVSVRPFSVIGY